MVWHRLFSLCVFLKERLPSLSSSLLSYGKALGAAEGTLSELRKRAETLRARILPLLEAA
jgi:hypothetical protein